MRNRMKPIIAATFACVLTASGETTSYPEPSARVSSKGNTTYHVDPARGDDANSGIAPDQPWKTFHPVNRINLAAGDRVEINPGRFDHTLSLAGSGSAELPIEVRFAPGRYDFDPVNARREAYQISNTNSDPDGLKAVGLHIFGAKHLRITGPGAVIHARGKMMHACIDGGGDVTVDGLAFDYNRPTVSEFKVTAVGDDFADFTIHKDSAYKIENQSIVWQGEGWTETGGLGQELDPETGLVHRLRDPLAGLKFVETEPFHIRARGKHRLKAGCIYQVRNPFRDCCGAFIRNSRDITWQNVHFRFMHGMGIVSQFSENLTFDGVRIEPDQASGRTTAAWADCIHLSGCKGKVLVRGTVFSGAHDDAINIHGTYLRVTERLSDRKIRACFMHPQTFGFMAFRPGDEIEFLHSDSMAGYGSNRIVEARMEDPKTLLLTLEQPVPEKTAISDVIENVTWTPEVEIRDCKVMRIPTRGFLITTRRKVLVENNDFLATQMSAIQVDADARSWFESGCVRDMTIRGNRFHLCGDPVIAIQPRNSVPNPEFHRNIRIEKNFFQLRGPIAVAAKSTTGLRVTENRILTKPGADETRLIQTSDCADAVIHNPAG